MRVVVTKDCENHHTAPNYLTVLVYWDGNEFNMRPKGFRGNWQPTDDELLDVVSALAERSPTFAEKLVRYAVTLDTWGNSYHGRSKGKPITDLAEMLL